jgi:hypothetical protein
VPSNRQKLSDFKNRLFVAHSSGNFQQKLWDFVNNPAPATPGRMAVLNHNCELHEMFSGLQMAFS